MSAVNVVKTLRPKSCKVFLRLPFSVLKARCLRENTARKFSLFFSAAAALSETGTSELLEQFSETSVFVKKIFRRRGQRIVAKSKFCGIQGRFDSIMKESCKSDHWYALFHFIVI